MAKESRASTLRSYDRVADRIRLHRQVSSSAVLLVEGVDDKLVLSQVLEDVDIFICGGRNILLEAIETISFWSIDRVAGVFDRDFDEESGYGSLTLGHPYQGRDLEDMLLQLGVLAHVISHFGSATKLGEIGGSQTLIERLVECVSPVTRLRESNARNRWGLRFDGVPLEKKIERNTLSLPVRGYCTALRAASDCEVELKTLVEAAESSVDVGRPRGKDVASAAGVALRKLAGGLTEAAASTDFVVKAMHASSGLAILRSEWIAILKKKLEVDHFRERTDIRDATDLA